MQMVSGISKLNLTHDSAVEWLTVALLHIPVFIAEGRHDQTESIEGQNQVTWSSIAPQPAFVISPAAHKLVH